MEIILVRYYLKRNLKRNSVNNIRKWHEYDTHNLQSVITKSNRRPDYVAKNQFPFFKITFEDKKVEYAICK